MSCCNTLISGINVRKTADVQRANPGDIITYTIEVINSSYVNLDTVLIKDIIPPQLTLVSDSISPAPKFGENLQTGVSIENIPANTTAVLRYSVTVNEQTTGAVINEAQAFYHYRDSAGSDHYENMHSLPSIVNIVSQSGTEVVLTKMADRRVVSVNGEILVYTITVENTGTVDLEDVVVIDDIPCGMKYVKNSTVINGFETVNTDPENGIFIGILPVESPVITIQYKACVCDITNGIFASQAIINGTYESGELSERIEEVSNLLIIETAPCTVTIAKNICSNVFIPWLNCVEDIDFSINDIQIFELRCGTKINVNYQMNITYTDYAKRVKTISKPSSTAFCTASQNLNQSDIFVEFVLKDYKKNCNQINIFTTVKLYGPFEAY